MSRFANPSENDLHINRELVGKKLNSEIIKKDEWKGFDYISVADVVALLNKIYSDKWNFEIVNVWTEQFLDIDVFYHAHCRMTIDGIGTREQCSTVSFRGHCLKGKESRSKKLSQLEMSDIIDTNLDMLYKTAVSDCIKKLASYFHVAEELYGGSKCELLETDELKKGQKESLEKIKVRLGEKFNDFLGSWLLANGELTRNNFNSFVETVKESLKTTN